MLLKMTYVIWVDISEALQLSHFNNYQYEAGVKNFKF